MEENKKSYEAVLGKVKNIKRYGYTKNNWDSEVTGLSWEEYLESCRNNRKAWKFFNPNGSSKNNYQKKGYVLHHIDEELVQKDLKRYIQWNPEDLIMLTKSEHSKIHNKKRVFSDEYKKRMSTALKGRVFSEEHRRKIALKKKGQFHSYETKMKISIANKGRLSWNAKKVMCLETGLIFESASKASSYLCKNPLAVSNAIRRNQRCGGYKWKYIN